MTTGFASPHTFVGFVGLSLKRAVEVELLSYAALVDTRSGGIHFTNVEGQHEQREHIHMMLQRMGHATHRSGVNVTLRQCNASYLVTKRADKSTSADPTGTEASTAVAAALAVARAVALLLPCLCTVSCNGWTCRAWARDSSAVTCITSCYLNQQLLPVSPAVTCINS